MSEQEFARLTKKRSTPKRKAAKQQDPESGHTFEREGSRYVCVRCKMGVPLRFLGAWQEGFYSP